MPRNVQISSKLTLPTRCTLLASIPIGFYSHQLARLAGQSNSRYSIALVKVVCGTMNTQKVWIMPSVERSIITYIVPATPRAINWARPLTKKPPVTGWAGAMKPPKTPIPTGVHLHEKTISGGARQAKRSLDSAVSSLLALISREYAQLV